MSIRVIPESDTRSDWPRLVAQVVNKQAIDVSNTKEAAPSRAALWFFA